MKEFDPESLAPFNGKEGKPAYIAQGGKVVDVSASKLWKAGIHMNRHRAGGDLTAELTAAPHGPDVLERYPQIGILKGQEAAPSLLPKPLEDLLARFPILRRHPHPMLVHFPIVFSIAPALFFSLFWLTGERSFEATALHCLAAGILFWVPAVLTGFLSWWVNYQAKSLRAVRIKIGGSCLLIAGSLGAVLWRVLAPETILASASGKLLYGLLLGALIPLVSVIGWFGASLTFPLEKR
ncbi:MAG: cytochrome b5 [Deltaproteobacteria bacterium]|nr:cytochrome b5 [Deltaproteobacteria bacterium]